MKSAWIEIEGGKGLSPGPLSIADYTCRFHSPYTPPTSAADSSGNHDQTPSRSITHRRWLCLAPV